jgi:hypothetical protein
VGTSSPKRTKNDEQGSLRAKIIAGLDVAAEYRRMGLNLKSDKPRASGKIEAHSAARPDESKPSAWIDVNTGLYGAKGEKDPDTASGPLSIFDYAVKYGGYADFSAAFKYFAGRAGVELKGRKKKGPEDPYQKLEFDDWYEGNNTLAEYWCIKHKPGTSLEVLKAAGARIAYYPCWFDKEDKKQRGKYKVIALPCFGPQLATAPPVAWVLYNINGQPLEVWRGKDVPPDLVKMKSCGPTAGTLMNEAAIQRLVTNREGIELVWKTAGPSDMLAMMKAMPEHLRSKHVVVCNAGGEDSDVHHWNVELLAGQAVNVIHDADKTGELGVLKWKQALGIATRELRHVRLPYEIEEKSGLDVRHFFAADAKTYDDMLALAAASPPIVVSPDATEQVKSDDMTAIERHYMTMIRVDVLGQLERGGIKVFSEFHRKSEVIPDIGRMSYDALLRIAGPPVKQCVLVSNKEDKPGMIGFDDVRHAIALLGGYKRISDQTELGAGCWRGMDAAGEAYPSVVLVGNREAAEWNGDKQLVQIDHPRCKGHLLDFDSGAEPWYEHAALKTYVEACDFEFARKAMHETIALFDLFRWKHTASSVTMTGLVLATWVQSLWDWRPQVAILGPSNSGKTTLFNVLAKLFGNLTVKSSHSSAAGIRQAIKTSSKVILCDEFESSRHREEILEMLRMSGRGDKVLRGTINQRGQGFGLQHIAWVAAIEVGLKRAPDRNRFIMLELEKPPQTKEKKRFVLPLPAQLADLGQRLLAVAIHYVLDAQPLAMVLRDHRSPDVDDRIVESYAVPAAILAGIQGFNEAEARELMEEMLAGVDREQGKIADENDLMASILSAHIHTGKETLSVAQLIDAVINDDHTKGVAEESLAKCGIKVDSFGNREKIPRALAHQKCLVISYQAVTKHLLRGTPWESQSIDQILRRIPGAIQDRRRIGGLKQRCILISKEILDREFLGRREEEQPPPFA